MSLFDYGASIASHTGVLFSAIIGIDFVGDFVALLIIIGVLTLVIKAIIYGRDR